MNTKTTPKTGTGRRPIVPSRPIPNGLMIDVPIDLLKAHPDNPRSRLDDIDDLAESIRDYGLLQPISVQPQPDGTFLILGGHRRVAAYRKNLEQYRDETDRWSKIAAVIGHTPTPDTDNPLRSTLTLVSQQLHTKAWSPSEEARAYDNLHQQDMSVRQIAEALHRSPGLVSKRRRVYSDDVLSAPVQKGLLKPGVAEELLTVNAGHTRRALVQKAIQEHWTQAMARDAVRRLEPVRRARQAAQLADDLATILVELHPDDFSAQQQKRLWRLRGEIIRIANRQERGATRERIIPTMVQAPGKKSRARVHG